MKASIYHLLVVMKKKVINNFEDMENQFQYLKKLKKADDNGDKYLNIKANSDNNKPSDIVYWLGFYSWKHEVFSSIFSQYLYKLTE